jgi:hypothetical protein
VNTFPSPTSTSPPTTLYRFLRWSQAVVLLEQMILLVGLLGGFYGCFVLLGWGIITILSQYFYVDVSGIHWVMQSIPVIASVVTILIFFKMKIKSTWNMRHLTYAAWFMEKRHSYHGELATTAEFLTTSLLVAAPLKKRYFTYMAAQLQQHNPLQFFRPLRILPATLFLLLIAGLLILVSFLLPIFTPLDFITKGYAAVPDRVVWEPRKEPIQYDIYFPDLILAGTDFQMDVEHNADEVQIFVQREEWHRTFDLEHSPFVLTAPDQGFQFRVFFKKTYKHYPPELVYTPWYDITVHHRPFIRAIAATYSYPTVYQWESEVIEDNGNLVGFHGTQVDLQVTIPGSIHHAAIQLDSDSTVRPLHIKRKYDTQTDEWITELATSLSIQKDDGYRLFFWDHLGFRNAEPITYTITRLVDRRPTLELIFPGEDLEWEQPQSQMIVLEGEDDYGLSRFILVGKRLKGTRVAKELWREYFPTEHQLMGREEWKMDWRAYDLQAGETLGYYGLAYDIMGQQVRTRTYTIKLVELEEVVEQKTRAQLETLESLQEEQEDINDDLEQLLQNEASQSSNNQQTTEEMRKQLESLYTRERDVTRALQNASEELAQMESQLATSDLNLAQEVVEKSQEIRRLIEELVDDQTRDLLRQMDRAIQQANEGMQPGDLAEQMPDMEQYVRRMEKILEQLKVLQQMKTMVQAEQVLQDLRQQQSRLNEKLETATEDMRDELHCVTFNVEKFQRLMDQPGDDPISEAMQEMAEQARTHQDEELAALREGLEQRDVEQAQEAGDQLEHAWEEMADSLQQMVQELKNRSRDELQQFIEQIISELQQISQEQAEQEAELESMASKRMYGGRMPSDELLEYQLTQKNHQNHLRRRQKDFLRLAEGQVDKSSSINQQFSDLLNHLEYSDKIFERALIPQMEEVQEQTIQQTNQLALRMMRLQQELQQNQCQNGQPGGSGSMNFENLAQAQQQLNESIQQMWQQLGEGKQLSAAEQAYLQQLAAQQAGIRQGLQQLMEEQAARLEENGGETGSMGDTGTLTEEMEHAETMLQLEQLNQELMETQEHILQKLLEYSKGLKSESKNEEQREAKTVEDPPLLEDDQTLLRRALADFLQSQRQNRATGFYRLQPEERSLIQDYFEWMDYLQRTATQR